MDAKAALLAAVPRIWLERRAARAANIVVLLLLLYTYIRLRWLVHSLEYGGYAWLEASVREEVHTFKREFYSSLNLTRTSLMTLAEGTDRVESLSYRVDALSSEAAVLSARIAPVYERLRGTSGTTLLRTLIDDEARNQFSERGAYAERSSGSMGKSCMSREELEADLTRRLEMDLLDGMFDHAASVFGGAIVFDNMLTSPSYPLAQVLSGTLRHVMGLKSSFLPPESTIRAQLSWKRKKGQLQCWAFPSHQGKISVRLSQPAVATHVTIEQRPRDLASALEARAAPRVFRVWSLQSVDDLKPRSLGEFEFNVMGGKQLFKLNRTLVRPGFVSNIIALDVVNNHGNREFTCLQRFRVHSAD
uniref:SUN domain-containing protein n=1 Tax=Rhizochromulina marina TaxID=1034831 RepID=A0A7S2SVR1_9STRA|mmetsp:Transcript_9593/g.27195  ORF Transcript_9593/g.27195 Transcript_9593/m.27195 type:complete len:361 (+) Transcript_9593:131-1213(+)